MITLTHGAHTVEINYPLWEGYEASVFLATEIIETCAGFSIIDNGDSRMYRKCSIQRSWLSENECSNLDVFFNGHRTDVLIEMDIGTDSGFFPFLPDYGDTGVFSVYLAGRKYGQFDQFKQFNKSYDFILSSPPSYSIPPVFTQGQFQIGSVDGLLYPQTGIVSDRVYGVNYGLTYNGTVSAVDIRRNIHTAGFTQRCNGGLAAELVDFLTGAYGRANDITIVAPDDYYLFDIANGASGTYTCKLIQNEITCRQLDYEEFEIPLTMWMKQVVV